MPFQTLEANPIVIVEIVRLVLLFTETVTTVVLVVILSPCGLSNGWSSPIESVFLPIGRIVGISDKWPQNVPVGKLSNLVQSGPQYGTNELMSTPISKPPARHKTTCPEVALDPEGHEHHSTRQGPEWSNTIRLQPPRP